MDTKNNIETTLIELCRRKLRYSAVQSFSDDMKNNIKKKSSFSCWLSFFHQLSHKKHTSIYANLPTLLKRVVYGGSLVYNRIQFDFFKQPASFWYTKITDFIYLGALPLEKHLGSLKREQITEVLSVVEDFERHPSWVATPLDTKILKEQKIIHSKVTTSDFFSIPLSALAQGVHYLRQAIQKQRRIYVHCKAGKGRSAAVVVAYLCTYGGMSFAQAYELVSDKRPIISLQSKKDSILCFYHLYALIEKKSHKQHHWSYLEQYIDDYCLSSTNKN